MPRSRSIPPAPAALTFGVANVLTAALLFFGVFVALPARWWPVDAGAGILLSLELASGVALLRGAAWAARAATAACLVALALGLSTVTLLAATASWLAGVYGPIGRGGAIILALVAALALPYIIVLPAVELLWLRRVGAGAAGDGAGTTGEK
jgi:hypothetical protein